jgi:anaerobic ribonucleoside-triphosphate reductase activating protein
MLKFLDVAVVTEEIPTEISLAIEITNCPHRCEGCHSPQLQEDQGGEVNSRLIDLLLQHNPLITCIVLMGGDADHKAVAEIADYIRSKKVKAAMYSGDDLIDKDLISHLDYYKVGSYQKSFGPLNHRGTNQHLYSIANGKLNDITYLFWGKDNIVDVDSQAVKQMDEAVNNFKDGKVSEPINLKSFDKDTNK